MTETTKDCIHVCRCACHDPVFASKAKHKGTCCDGKCKHCDSFIVRYRTKDHLRDCHPVTIEIPYFLRKSSD